VTFIPFTIFTKRGEEDFQPEKVKWAIILGVKAFSRRRLHIKIENILHLVSTNKETISHTSFFFFFLFSNEIVILLGMSLFNVEICFGRGQ